MAEAVGPSPGGDILGQSQMPLRAPVVPTRLLLTFRVLMTALHEATLQMGLSSFSAGDAGARDLCTIAQTTADPGLSRGQHGTHGDINSSQKVLAWVRHGLTELERLELQKTT